MSFFIDKFILTGCAAAFGKYYPEPLVRLRRGYTKSLRVIHGPEKEIVWPDSYEVTLESVQKMLFPESESDLLFFPITSAIKSETPQSETSYRIPQTVSYKVLKCDNTKKQSDVLNWTALSLASIYPLATALFYRKSSSIFVRVARACFGVFGVSLLVKSLSVQAETHTILVGSKYLANLPQAISPEMRKNISIAQEILKLTEDRLPMNYFRGKLDVDQMSDSEYQETLRKRLSSHNHIGEGNCREIARLGLKLLNDKHPEILHATTCESYSILFGDHSFIIIGPRNSQDSILCDPWARTYFPLAQKEKYLRDYAGDIRIHGRQEAVVKPLTLINLLIREKK
ncbi:MAG TPA: hypothetical protein VLE96_06885 [Chlamydiales bacterium]|nr:hypothetical protein [Chlamydiales bacterium]